ncbi:MAG: PCRF domain-containing protein, partial [Clostridia bacterium]|nr:PCRF domain-containing protein [Clostridia bacterium]
MLDRINMAEKRYDEIAHRLCDPSVLANNDEYRKLTKESKTIEPIVEAGRAYKAALKKKDDADSLLKDASLDASLKELAELELEEAKEELQRQEEVLNKLFNPEDNTEDRNIIMEIRSGTGGEESALFAGSLFRMYSMYAESKGWSIEVISSNETELGGYKEIIFSISGTSVYHRLKFESGGHRVQRVPETESGGRIHTSAATVAVMPEVEDVEIEVRPEDIRMEVYR